MNRKKLETILKLELSPEIKRTIEETLASCKAGEIPKEAEKRIRDLLKLEVDFLDIRAGLCGELSGIASQFIGEIEEVLSPDFEGILQASKKRVRRKLEDFVDEAKARIDAFEVETFGESYSAA